MRLTRCISPASTANGRATVPVARRAADSRSVHRSWPRRGCLLLRRRWLRTAAPCCGDAFRLAKRPLARPYLGVKCGLGVLGQRARCERGGGAKNCVGPANHCPPRTHGAAAGRRTYPAKEQVHADLAGGVPAGRILRRCQTPPCADGLDTMRGTYLGYQAMSGVWHIARRRAPYAGGHGLAECCERSLLVRNCRMPCPVKLCHALQPQGVPENTVRHRLFSRYMPPAKPLRQNLPCHWTCVRPRNVTSVQPRNSARRAIVQPYRSCCPAIPFVLALLEML